MKQTEKHKPVFKGLHRNSTTVCAYCPKCENILKDYLQPKCDKCGCEMFWWTKKGISIIPRGKGDK